MCFTLKWGRKYSISFLTHKNNLAFFGFLEKMIVNNPNYSTKIFLVTCPFSEYTVKK